MFSNLSYHIMCFQITKNINRMFRSGRETTHKMFQCFSIWNYHNCIYFLCGDSEHKPRVFVYLLILYMSSSHPIDLKFCRSPKESVSTRWICLTRVWMKFVTRSTVPARVCVCLTWEFPDYVGFIRSLHIKTSLNINCINIAQRQRFSSTSFGHIQFR